MFDEAVCTTGNQCWCSSTLVQVVSSHESLYNAFDSSRVSAERVSVAINVNTTFRENYERYTIELFLTGSIAFMAFLLA